MLYTDLFEMIRDMQRHALLDEVVVCDDPMARCIGYAGTDTDRKWLISLVNCKRSMDRKDLSPRENQVRDLLKTAVGRQDLIRHFPL